MAAGYSSKAGKAPQGKVKAYKAIQGGRWRVMLLPLARRKRQACCHTRWRKARHGVRAQRARARSVARAARGGRYASARTRAQGCVQGIQGIRYKACEGVTLQGTIKA